MSVCVRVRTLWGPCDVQKWNHSSDKDRILLVLRLRGAAAVCEYLLRVRRNESCRFCFVCPLELGEKLKNPEMNMKLPVNVSPLGTDVSHCRRRTYPRPALTFHLSLRSLLLFYYMYIPRSGLKSYKLLGVGAFSLQYSLWRWAQNTMMTAMCPPTSLAWLDPRSLRSQGSLLLEHLAHCHCGECLINAGHPRTGSDLLKCSPIFALLFPQGKPGSGWTSWSPQLTSAWLSFPSFVLRKTETTNPWIFS